MEAIRGGEARITLGGFVGQEELIREARETVIILRSGQLPTSLTLASEEVKLDLDQRPVDPLTDNVQNIRYLPDGRLTCNDDAIQLDLDQRLNLNAEVLKQQRKAVLDSLKTALNKKLGAKKSWTTRKLENDLSALREKPRLPIFFGLYEFWITDQIRRRPK